MDSIDDSTDEDSATTDKSDDDANDDSSDEEDDDSSIDEDDSDDSIDELSLINSADDALSKISDESDDPDAEENSCTIMSPVEPVNRVTDDAAALTATVITPMRMRCVCFIEGIIILYQIYDSLSFLRVMTRMHNRNSASTKSAFYYFQNIIQLYFSAL